MDIFFQDPNEIPLPPAEVRLRQLRAEPWPDGQRVKIYLEVDPFQKRPSAEVTITDSAGDEVAQVSIVETMIRNMEFNMHLPSGRPGGEYSVQAVIYYEQPLPADAPPDAERPAPMIVDRGQAAFTIPAA
jgi:hypothetical protein